MITELTVNKEVRMADDGFVSCECVECPCTRVVSSESAKELRDIGDDVICIDCDMDDHNEAES